MKKLSLWSALGILLSLSASSAPLSVTTDQIRQAITAKKLHWQVKDNWLSKLPRDQIQRMLGVSEPPNQDAQFRVSAGNRGRFHILDAAPKIDWRAKDGINYVSPILNQGNCGSCVAFSTVATLETQVNIASGIPGLNPSFSPQALFACGGGGCDFGWMPNLAAKFLASNGVPDEACAPYTMGATGEDVACNSICKDAPARSTKIVNYSAPTTGTTDIEAVKNALKSGPLVTTLLVYEDFIGYAGGLYKHAIGTSLGGHAVSIVGYDESERSWIIRNSWGEEWGDKGFAHVSWDDVSGIGDNTWGFEVASAQGYVTVRNPHGRHFLSGDTSFEAESTYPSTQKVELTVLSMNPASGETKTVETLSCLDSHCKKAYDTRKLADGYYQVVASADWGSDAKAQSQYEQFYVLNGKPNLSLSATPVSGTDLSKPLNGRIVFNLHSETGSDVPLTSILFTVRDEQGKVVLTRSASIVLPDMTFGWRTNSSPNGRYEISFTGRLTTNSGESTVESPHVRVTTAN